MITIKKEIEVKIESFEDYNIFVSLATALKLKWASGTNMLDYIPSIVKQYLTNKRSIYIRIVDSRLCFWGSYDTLLIKNTKTMWHIKSFQKACFYMAKKGGTLDNFKSLVYSYKKSY